MVTVDKLCVDAKVLSIVTNYDLKRLLRGSFFIGDIYGQEERKRWRQEVLDDIWMPDKILGDNYFTPIKLMKNNGIWRNLKRALKDLRTQAGKKAVQTKILPY